MSAVRLRELEPTGRPRDPASSPAAGTRLEEVLVLRYENIGIQQHRYDPGSARWSFRPPARGESIARARIRASSSSPDRDLAQGRRSLGHYRSRLRYRQRTLTK